jgi:hypothetical protein
MSGEQIALLDAAQNRVLDRFYAVGGLYEREEHPCRFDTLDGCRISWESIVSVDPYAQDYVDVGGES